MGWTVNILLFYKRNISKSELEKNYFIGRYEDNNCLLLQFTNIVYRQYALKTINL